MKTMDLNASRGEHCNLRECFERAWPWNCGNVVCTTVSDVAEEGDEAKLGPAVLFEVWNTGHGLKGVDVPSLFESVLLKGQGSGEDEECDSAVGNLEESFHRQISVRLGYIIVV